MNFWPRAARHELLLRRYGLQSFKDGAEIQDQDGMIVVISRSARPLTNVWSEYGRSYSICPKV
jgi:hypothetical protein